MTKEEIFDAWAPAAAVWSPWVKPVSFSQLDAITPNAAAMPDESSHVNWSVDAKQATAIVVDLPCALGLNVGLRLAASGYRPVPLYNACPEPPGEIATVNVRPILDRLAAGAPLLRSFNLPANAPPAFLLDADRNSGEPVAWKFDNRSISLPTDFPSSNLLHSCGIRQIMLVQAGRNQPLADVSHTLRRWQDAGLTILSVDVNTTDGPRPITVERPKAFRLLWYNLLAKLGLKTSPLGGFGGRLPMPSIG